MSGSFENGIVTDSSWVCSSEHLIYWNSIHFNPRAYYAAIEKKPVVFEERVSTDAMWIQATNAKQSKPYFCRKQIHGKIIKFLYIIVLHFFNSPMVDSRYEFSVFTPRLQWGNIYTLHELTFYFDPEDILFMSVGYYGHDPVYIWVDLREIVQKKYGDVKISSMCRVSLFNTVSRNSKANPSLEHS